MNIMEKNPIVLLCECGVADHPDVNRPWIWLTPQAVNSLTRDHPVTAMGNCNECEYTIYIMRKCVCKGD